MKKFLPLLMGAVISLSTALTAYAETVEISIVEKPNVDILLTTGDFTSDLKNFEKDITNALQKDGINTSGINFQTIETSVTSTDSMEPITIMNDWGRIGLTGKWSLSTVDGKTSIYNSENTAGITGFYCKDNYNLKNMMVEFDVKTTDSDNDAIGVFLRFNLDGGTTESTANSSKKATTYMYTEEIGADTHVLPNGLYKISNQVMALDSKYSTYVNNGSYKKLQGLLNTTTDKLTQKSWRHYKFIIKGNNIKVYRGSALVIDYTDPSPIKSGTFGLMNWSQPAAFANFTASCEVERDFGEVLTEPTWRADATHMIINVDTNNNNTLTSSPEVLARTLADNIYFVQWGTNENKALSENFIKLNDNKGMFTLGAESADYQTAVNNTVEYIENLLDINTETQYVVVGRETDLEVEPEQYKTNASNIEYPNGRWIIHHNYTYFDNNLGQSAQTENYTPNLLLNFDKPGAYDIYFDDMLVKTVYAHRLPVADFTVDISNKAITLESKSFDEDDNKDIGFGKGIAKETWYYKKADATTWTEGKLTEVPTTAHMIKLEVEDFQGATNYTTKYVGVGNPVSYFLTDKTQFSKYYNLLITDTSYDPTGYAITGWEWTLKSGKTTLATYTQKQPTIDFKQFGAGTYSLSLKVKNENNIWSENYTRGLTVTEDTVAPSVTIDPTYCDWKESQDINISIEDSDSGLNKWRYCYTQDQSEPAESQWGQWQTVENETLTFDTDGEYYLHFEAYDNAGNKLTRTVGSYKITHPYTNKVNHDFGLVNKTEFVTFDWGKWYNPTEQFEEKVNGFEPSENFLADYPVAGTSYGKTDRLKQPSGSIEYNFTYKPIEYTATIDYGYDEKIETKTFTVLEGFDLERPVREGYEFVGWYIGDKLIKDVNFNKDNNFASFESFASAMDSRIYDDVTITARWNQTEITGRTNVFAQIASEYKVTIPKTVVLSGTSKAASYYVKVEGDIAGYEKILVTPDSTFNLRTPGKDNQEANVNQDKVSWTVHDFDRDANGTISAPGITAGKWLGAFNFNIEFNSPDEENINSEESVEYQVIEYPSNAVIEEE